MAGGPLQEATLLLGSPWWPQCYLPTLSLGHARPCISAKTKEWYSGWRYSWFPVPFFMDTSIVEGSLAHCSGRRSEWASRSAHLQFTSLAAHLLKGTRAVGIFHWSGINLLLLASCFFSGSLFVVGPWHPISADVHHSRASEDAGASSANSLTGINSARQACSTFPRISWPSPP